MTNIAVVGAGGWGKNLIRNYYQIPESSLKTVCDLDTKKLEQIKSLYPGVSTTTDFDEVIKDPVIQGIVIATTGETHFELCSRALDAGKDVYVEKPFTLHVAEAEQLVAKADQLGRIIMVGHLLEYHPVVNRLKEMINAGDLGQIHYIYSQRLNLGTVREDENALWNFAPHDISVILYLLGKEAVDVSARGQCYLRNNIEDVVFLSINFADGTTGHIHVSWLDPHKVRKTTIVGSKKMAVFDDMESSEKLRVYDKGAKFSEDYNTFAEYVGLRFGDITIPHINVGEPLKLECTHFIECINSRQQPLSDGRDGLRVIKVLEAAQQSLKQNGQPVSIAG
jgi:predicted dehydrogenase